MNIILPEILQHILSWSSELDKQLLRSTNKYLHNLILKSSSSVLFLCFEEDNSILLNRLTGRHTRGFVEEAVYTKNLNAINWCVTNKIRGIRNLDRYVGMYASYKVFRLLQLRGYPCKLPVIIKYAIIHTKLKFIDMYCGEISCMSHYNVIKANPKVQEHLGENWALMVKVREVLVKKGIHRDIKLKQLNDYKRPNPSSNTVS